MNDNSSLNIALPKGRLGAKVYEMLEAAGYGCPGILDNTRKLIFENEDKTVKYFWAKPSDVQIYVERGTADIGICGKDILLEYEPDVYEIYDLNIGKCKLCVAAKSGFSYVKNRTLKVATKFSNCAEKFYNNKNINIDLIHLNGSIEIAPILGLSDVIVDLVETGSTLKENNLEVVEEIFPVSARLIANKSSYMFKQSLIDDIKNKLSENVE